MRTDHFEALLVSIEETLIVESSEGGALARYRGCVQLAEEAIQRVREELLGDPFFDRLEEIRFYKEEAPRVWGAYLYYRRLAEIEVWRKTRSPERFRELLRMELRRAEVYPEEHSIREYYYLGQTDSDERYFARRRVREPLTEEMGMFLDADMPVGTYRLAWMRAYESLREWLIDALEELDYQLMGIEQRRKLECMLTPMEAIELFKGLHEANVFGNWPFKRVMFWVGENMGIKVSNYNHLLQDLQRRKGNRTTFLDKIKEELVRYMDSKK